MNIRYVTAVPTSRSPPLNPPNVFGELPPPRQRPDEGSALPVATSRGHKEAGTALGGLGRWREFLQTGAAGRQDFTNREVEVSCDALTGDGRVSTTTHLAQERTRGVEPCGCLEQTVVTIEGQQTTWRLAVRGAAMTTAADESVASRAVAAALDAFNEPSMLQALQAVRHGTQILTTALMHSKPPSPPPLPLSRRGLPRRIIWLPPTSSTRLFGWEGTPPPLSLSVSCFTLSNPAAPALTE